MRSTLAFPLVLLLVATPCSAQSPGAVEFTPVAGPYQSRESGVVPPCRFIKGAPNAYCDNEAPASKSATVALVGGRVTVWLSRGVAVEGSLMGSPQAFTSPVFASARGVASFAPRSRLWAYFLAGPALVYATDGSGTDVGGVLGAGAHFRVAQSLSVRAEVERYLGAGDQLAAHSNAFLTLGLSVAMRLAGREKGSDVPER